MARKRPLLADDVLSFCVVLPYFHSFSFFYYLAKGTSFSRQSHWYLPALFPHGFSLNRTS